ncbi:Gfo/Idh/MocA family protein [Thermostaphylospora chromogena]|uniref:Oxidoreductase family, NAD-binding Rossmann fold n=1 Tax=Thermostaphylospora chromogena TaxID=35622 RepID=A0A1H1A300_9ACTN|nr:Gfo/Idh/MocA family oxidoreductase [Thermostaphylospora chromogena]SDQ34057.1 Oxidoreductase family, NAD-binding Rossmann fold [Thermostaphylospora chromogena]
MSSAQHESGRPSESGYRRRYAIVGTGARAEMFVRALAVDHAERCELVALADTNPVRARVHNEALTAYGAPPAAVYDAADFRRMLDAEQVDTVVVTTVDRFHDEYIVAALDAGRDVITEKPMTIDADRCRSILDAVARTGRRVTVTFNYRYNPLHEKVRELLANGEIGEIGSVHFEWLLDVRHGADYFRRWHRDKANSGGLLVHKATHHFDLINWWLGAVPEQVYAQGRLFFYGDEAGRRHGYARDYERAYGSPEAIGDPFALDLAAADGMRRLYLEAEGHDGYHRDRNVFAPGVTIEDDLAVLVRYSTGATMTYHLTAYSPWEGYRVMFNGSRGRLEVEVVENDHVIPAPPRGDSSPGVPGDAPAGASAAYPADASPKSASLHGAEAAAERGWSRLRVCPFWREPYDVEVPDLGRAGHGGADARLAAALFGGDTAPDPLGRGATERDGALSLLTGLAGNESLVTGAPVRVADILDLGAYTR